jgi:hypothetical protein
MFLVTHGKPNIKIWGFFKPFFSLLAIEKFQNHFIFQGWKKTRFFSIRKSGFLVSMNKTRFSPYKTWFYFGVGQAPGHPHPCHAHNELNAEP